MEWGAEKLQRRSFTLRVAAAFLFFIPRFTPCRFDRRRGPHAKSELSAVLSENMQRAARRVNNVSSVSCNCRVV